MNSGFKIITFYEFKRFSPERLSGLRDAIRSLMKELGIYGTVILAEEGYNATVAGETVSIGSFVERLEEVLETKIEFKASFFDELPFRKVDVKIKPEIVTLKKPVDVGLGEGTHVPAEKWNEVISAEDVVILDTRNDYEYCTGTFNGAVNPETQKFSDLPEFIAKNLDPSVNKKVAMFCTGGIRCEKFAPYMRSLGFSEVFQLEGGILKYLEVVPPDEQLLKGEWFVFDDRRTVDKNLEKGISPDLSLPSVEEISE